MSRFGQVKPGKGYVDRKKKKKFARNDFFHKGSNVVAFPALTVARCHANSKSDKVLQRNGY